MTAGRESNKGQMIIYTISYENVGTQDATGVVITDTVPAHTTFSAGSSATGWVCSPNDNAGSVCSYTVGNLAAGDDGSVLFAVLVDNPLPSTVTQIDNTACGRDDGTNGPDMNPGDNCDDEDTPIIPRADAHAHPDPDADCDPDGHTHPHAHGDANRHPLQNLSADHPRAPAHPNANPDSHPHSDDHPTLTVTPTPLPITTPTRIPIPDLVHPKGVAVNPRTNRIYVSSRDNDALMVVDGPSNSKIAQIPVCDEPFGVDANSMTNKIYVACFASGVVNVINGDTNTVIKTIPVGPEPTYVGINEKTNRVYVASHGNNALVEINGVY